MERQSSASTGPRARVRPGSESGLGLRYRVSLRTQAQTAGDARKKSRNCASLPVSDMPSENLQHTSANRKDRVISCHAQHTSEHGCRSVLDDKLDVSFPGSGTSLASMWRMSSGGRRGGTCCILVSMCKDLVSAIFLGAFRHIRSRVWCKFKLNCG